MDRRRQSAKRPSGHAKRFPHRRNLGFRDRVILDLCRGKRVVHIGCTDWPYQEAQLASGALLHLSLLSAASACVGVDLDEVGIENLRSHFPGELFMVGDISSDQSLFDELVKFKPDVILVPDVLEHVENARSFLLGIGKLLAQLDTAECILSTPNAFSLKTFLPVFAGFDFTHSDHCLLHNEFTLEHVLADSNLAIHELNYYQRDISNRYGSMLSRISAPLDLIARIMPRLSDGLIVRFGK